MQKRFIYALNTNWYANETANKTTYKDSVVFIHDENGKGVEIFTQGAYFKTDVQLSDIEPLIKAYLKEGSNITLTTTADGDLEIAAKSVDSLTGKSASTELVQAKAVAGALTIPVSLTLSVEKGVGTFTETFKKLDGSEDEVVTAVFEAGDNITLTKGDAGLKISATDTTYSAGTGLTLTGNVFNHTNKLDAANTETKSDVTLGGEIKTFDFDQYSYDTEGHITGKVTNVVTLPDTAFVDTQYEVTMAASNEGVSLITKKDGQTESTYTIKGDEGTTVSFENGVMTISSDTASDILGTLNVTDTAVANQYVSEVDQTNGQISVTRATLPVYGVNETAVDGLKLSLTDGKVGLVDDGLAADLTSKNITLETAETATEGYLKTYVLKQGTTEIGKIDLPKELVVTSGEVVKKEDGEKYLRLTIANQETPVDIAVKDLVDVYTAGNGIAISDANVVSAKVKEGETYLKVGENGLYTDGIDTAISTEIAKLDGSATATTNATEGIVNVLTSVVEADGIISLGAETAVATATYVDNAIEGLDSQKGADATAADLKTDEIAVVTGVDVTQENGVITSVAVDSAKAATTTYVDNAIKGLDSNLGTALNKPISGENPEDIIGSNDQLFTKIVITDGKLDVTNSTVANVDNATLVDYTTTSTQKYVGITEDDTIAKAFAKVEESWDWGTI